MSTSPTPTPVPAVRSRPIVLSAPEVRAVLAGRKTQLRRIIFRPERFQSIRECGFCCPIGDRGDQLWVRETWQTHEDPVTMVDGILYRADNAFVPIENTREAAERWMDAAHLKARPEDMAEVRPGLLVGTARKAKGWRSPIHMPRWASRLTLEITEIRVQRLQEITEAEVTSEGIGAWLEELDGRAYDRVEKAWCRFSRQIDPEAGVVSQRGLFAAWWDATHGRKPGCSWSDSPWVWAISFCKVDQSASPTR